MHPPPVAVELDVFERVLLRLFPRLAALAARQLALERLEEGFRERVVPWVARPPHGSGGSMGLEAALVFDSLEVAGLSVGKFRA